MNIPGRTNKIKKMLWAKQGFWARKKDTTFKDRDKTAFGNETNSATGNTTQSHVFRKLTEEQG